MAANEQLPTTTTGSENCARNVSGIGVTGKESDGVRVLEEYMVQLVPHNPTWLPTPPSWATNMALPHEDLLAKIQAWREEVSWETTLPEVEARGGVSGALKVGVSEVYGRHLVARRGVRPGEVLLVEPPLVLALRAKSPPYCLSCFRRAGEFTCPDCGFFLCGAQCLTEEHQEECALLRRLGLGDSSEEARQEEKVIWERLASLPCEERTQAQALLQQAQKTLHQQRCLEVLRQYVVQPAVRTILAMGHSDMNRKVIMALQGNVERDSQRYRVNQKHIVAVVTNTLQAAADPALVHRVCSVWDTNGFEVPLGFDTRVHGLYPVASLLTHECRANTQQWFSNRGDLVLRAVDHIPEGAIVTTCYTDPLWATMLRQDHLRVSKQFTCTCRRCQDPTELGTFLGSPLCPGCGGPLVSSAPLDPTADWRCHSGCPHTAPAKEVARVGARVGLGLRGLRPNDAEALEAMADALRVSLHPTHHVLLQLHMSTLRTIVTRDLTEMSDGEITTLAAIADLVMGVVRALEAPLTRLTVRMAREEVRLQLELARRAVSRGHDPAPSRRRLQALSQQVADCSLVLAWDERMPSFLPVLRDYRAIMAQ
nr:uncharacterized protein LOC123763989 [Procambarus clarkii]XP_045607353.1 uncharacterized protein LOC123763989 [Procambarus clarkii]XP_045607354.1 uncharacterized protein LOC123763989 [Procambarus clarkii]XP_045607355.1 uncharacterized protein LOC123763989 [Procambarus clarkii]XP_045607356.1 uncharacterized protein LOC123763989 [Procambarus clarkii]